MRLFLRANRLPYDMAKQVTVKVPVRIDLAGGWTDVPTYCSEHTGEVVNIAIDRYITATSTLDAERKMEVRYTSELPTGCGLGTSGAMNVALVSVISSDSEPLNSIAEKAYQIEAVLGNTGGRQDQWACAFGGIQHLKFEGENVERTALNPSQAFVEYLHDYLLLFDTGIEHVSGELHQAVWKRYAQGDTNTIEGLTMLQKAAKSMHESVVDENHQMFEAALKSVMKGIDCLDPGLHDPFRSVLAPLVQTGQITAWKAMGAGGGGVVGVLRNRGAPKDQVIAAGVDGGWKHMPWTIDWKGLQRKETITRG